VVSFLSNPFQKNNLNFAVKNQQPLITPKMATSMRFSRGYNPNHKSVMTVAANSKASSIGYFKK